MRVLDVLMIEEEKIRRRSGADEEYGHKPTARRMQVAGPVPLPGGREEVIKGTGGIDLGRSVVHQSLTDVVPCTGVITTVTVIVRYGRRDFNASAYTPSTGLE